MISSKPDLTFQFNQRLGRHGWLRLTPAYSVKVVHDILSRTPSVAHVLDPFSGTGTTGLVSAELGLHCDLLEINPFLVWFAKVKTATYSHDALANAQRLARDVVRCVMTKSADDLWLPDLHNIERWWSSGNLSLLAKLRHHIYDILPAPCAERDLLWVAFCRVMIDTSNAAFNHQSMSFKTISPQLALFPDDEIAQHLERFVALVDQICEDASTPLTGSVQVTQADSKDVPFPAGYAYDCVITSPPYPNRMSYIRELRPYMYWTQNISEAREAGELDWQTIGGTWGIATSRVEKWQPDGEEINSSGFYEMLTAIRSQSTILANYVHKYFVDMKLHLTSLVQVLKAGSTIHYVVGNSKFYDTLVPVERIFCDLFTQAGFLHTSTEILRKRNSKKELYEYVVSARWE
jgi:hypothetical protein